MALADNYRILEYVSDGKQVEFPVLWRFFDPDTVLVKIYSKDGILVNHLSYGRDYSVIATGEDTGRVTLTAPVTSGLLVVIYRLEPYVQLLELLNSGKFDLVKLEETLDHIVMLCQQNRDEILRCLKVPPGSDMTGDEFIDDLLNKYNEIIFIFETIKKLMQNLVCQTIEPFVTKSGVRKYYIGEGLPLDPKLYNLLLVLGGVVQEPKLSYTILDENHIQFTEDPPAGLRGWGISAISTSTPDLRQMVQDALKELSYASKTQHGIMKVGGGLSVSQGLVAVNFDEMPPDQFNDILKQLRLPLWLEGDADFFVNGATGSDIVDEGRGQSAQKPFKTLQACIDYISENYNVGQYVLTINCQNVSLTGSYVILKEYQRTSGYIDIKGIGTNRVSSFQTTAPCLYNIINFEIDGNYKTDNNVYRIRCQYGTINLYNVKIYGGKKYSPEGREDLFIESYDGGIVNIPASSTLATGIDVITGAEQPFASVLYARDGGKIAFTADIRVSENCTVSAFANCNRTGSITCSASMLQNPGRPPIITSSGVITGKRFAVSLNAIISTGGRGQEFFPGTKNGTISNGGQYF